MNWKPVIALTVVGGLAAAAFYAMKFFKLQQQQLEDYEIEVIGIKFSSFTAEIITVEFTIRIHNKSAIEATVKAINADIYLNNVFVGKVENVGVFVIPAKGINDAKLSFTFANKQFIKNIVSTLFTLTNMKDVSYRLTGYVKLSSSFVSAQIPFDKTGGIKADMIGKK